jgi:membrane peptidoglycan carboxypeptidase
MGITTLGDRSRFGLSLVLGGAEVRLVDLVSAYGVFATEGTRNPWAFIQKIELADGKVLEEKKENPVKVLDTQTARLISDILSDNNARASVFGYNSPLYIPGREVAVKTGTTQENRDAWAVGYTPSIAVGVWTGNNDNSPMTKAGAGISAAGPLWHDFMVAALAARPPASFTKPDPVLVDKPMLNGSYRYQPLASSSFEVHSILYFVDRKNPLGSFPSNPSLDPQFQNWESAVRSMSYRFY